MQKPNFSPQMGFTLIEVLISIIIMLLILSLSISSLFAGGRGWQHIQQEALNTNAIIPSQNWLRKIISQSYPLSNSGIIYFNGSHNSLSLISLSQFPQLSSRLNQVTIYIKNSSTTRDLYVDIQAIDNNGNKHGELITKILLSDIESFNVSYFNSSKTARNDWLSRWQFANALPQMIKLEVAFSPNDPRYWPEQIIATALHYDTLCQYDIISRTCYRKELIAE